MPPTPTTASSHLSHFQSFLWSVIYVAHNEATVSNLTNLVRARALCAAVSLCWFVDREHSCPYKAYRWQLLRHR